MPFEALQACARGVGLRRALLLSAGAVLAIQAVSPAAASAAEREHGAHVHGVSRLNVAIEGHTVLMEWIAPGADIVGFEHPAESDADKAAVQDAVHALEDATTLFVFPPEAACRLESAEVETSLLEHHDGHDEHHDEGHDDRHDDEHQEDEHADHHEHEEGDEHHDETHSEFEIRYGFHCDQPDRLDHIEVKVFERFPGAEEIDAQVIAPGGQTAQELTPASSRLAF